jgi:tripartite ATP-independent transporter DctP family solute receptor
MKNQKTGKYKYYGLNISKPQLGHCMIVLLIIFLITGCGQSSNCKVLKLAHTLDTQHPVHLGIVFMAEKVKEKSGGQLEIQIYPSAQLGNERECLELLQVGSLAMTKVSAATLENFVPSYRVMGLPYLFNNKAHYFNVLDGDIGEQLLNDGIGFRLKGLCFYDAGSRSFYTKKAPVESPQDLEGLKIRVMKSNMAINMVNELGGAPTPISYGELYTALQQGVVDGAENNPPSFFTSRHYEVCKYYSLDEHTSSPDILIMGTDWWDRLTPQQQGWLKEAAKESSMYQRKVWKEAEGQALKAVEAHGVTIVRPDKGRFSEKVAAMYERIKDDPDLNRLVTKIKATRSDETTN